MIRAHIDFEVASALDIKKCGGALFVEHPSAIPLCAAMAFDDSEIIVLDQYELEDNANLRQVASDPAVIFVAHNAIFEQFCWTTFMVERFGYPEIPISRWRCTMSKGYTHSLPGSLDGLGKALGLEILKDNDGRKIMLRLTKPKKDGTFWTPSEDPEGFRKLYDYCATDVEVERLVDKKLRDLPAKEQAIWEIDQRINKKGLRFDIPLIEKAISFIKKDREIALAEFGDLVDDWQETDL